jgi:hypothetical protein
MGAMGPPAVRTVAVILLCAQVAFAADPPKPKDLPVVEEDSSLSEDVLKRMTPEEGREHRYLFLVGGVSAAIGLGLSYWAQGEARRANTLFTAPDARKAFDNARGTAAGANVLFAVAVVSVGYGLFLELLPKDIASKAAINRHF